MLADIVSLLEYEMGKVRRIAIVGTPNVEIIIIEDVKRAHHCLPQARLSCPQGRHQARN
jgi:hypothetical protein